MEQYATSIYDSPIIGLPGDPYAGLMPAGFEGAYTTTSVPPITSATESSVWGSIKAGASNFLDWTEEEIKKGYGVTKEALGTVYDDVSKPVTSALTGTYWYLIIGVVVIAGALYYVGKGGAIGQVASLK